MRIDQTNMCCGIDQLYEISEYNSAKAILLNFCKQSYRYLVWNKKWHCTVNAMYIFSGVEAIKGVNCKNVKPFSYVYEPYEGDDAKIKYASALADYIKKNKLGVVIRGGKAYNHLNHPTHLLATYTWVPNTDNLLAWYLKNKE